MKNLRPKKKQKWVAQLAEQIGYECWYCGAPLSRQIGSISPTLDHLIPLSHGGSNSFSNMVLACRFCNEAKRDNSVAVFLAWLEGVKQRQSASVVLPTGEIDFSRRKKS